MGQFPQDGENSQNMASFSLSFTVTKQIFFVKIFQLLAFTYIYIQSKSSFRL